MVHLFIHNVNQSQVPLQLSLQCQVSSNLPLKSYSSPSPVRMLYNNTWIDNEVLYAIKAKRLTQTTT